MYWLLCITLFSLVACVYPAQQAPAAKAATPADSVVSARSCVPDQPSNTEIFIVLRPVGLSQLEPYGNLVAAREGAPLLFPGTYVEVCHNPHDGSTLTVNQIWTYHLERHDNDSVRLSTEWERVAIDAPARYSWLMPWDNRIFWLGQRQIDAAGNPIFTPNASQQNERTVDFILDSPIGTDAGFPFSLRPMDRTSAVEENVRKVEITAYVGDENRRSACTMYLPPGTTQTVMPAHCLFNHDSFRLPGITGLDMKTGSQTLDAEAALATLAGQDMTTIQLYQWNPSQDDLWRTHQEPRSLQPGELNPGHDTVYLCGFPAYLQPPIDIGVNVRITIRGQVSAVEHDTQADIWSVRIQLPALFVPSLRGMSGSTVFVKRGAEMLPVAMVVAESIIALPVATDAVTQPPSFLRVANQVEALGLPDEMVCRVHHAVSEKIETEDRFLFTLDEQVDLLLQDEVEMQAFLREQYAPDEYSELHRLIEIFTNGEGMALLKVGSFRDEIFFVIGNSERATAYTFVIKPAYGDQGPNYEFAILRSLRGLALN